MGRPSPLKQSFDPPTRRKRARDPHRNPLVGKERMLCILIRYWGSFVPLGLMQSLCSTSSIVLKSKPRPLKKPLSEIVAELEAKERCAAIHSIHLQKVVDSKRQQLTQAETRLQAHLEEHEQIKEQLEIAHAKQVRHISRNPDDLDSAEESGCEIQEDSGGEEEEEEDEEVEWKTLLLMRCLRIYLMKIMFRIPALCLLRAKEDRRLPRLLVVFGSATRLIRPKSRRSC